MKCKLKICDVEFKARGKKYFCSQPCKDEWHRQANRLGEKAINAKEHHFTRLEGSPRLQRVAKYLSDKKPHSTMDIIMTCHVCDVPSIKKELIQNGFEINREQISNDLHLYTMTGGFTNLLRLEN